MSPLTMLKRRLVRPVCPEHEKEGPAEAAGLPEADRQHRASAIPLRRCRPPGTEGPFHPASSPERGTCGAVVAGVPGPGEARRPTGSTGEAPLLFVAALLMALRWTRARPGPVSGVPAVPPPPAAIRAPGARQRRPVNRSLRRRRPSLIHRGPATRQAGVSGAPVVPSPLLFPGPRRPDGRSAAPGNAPSLVAAHLPAPKGPAARSAGRSGVPAGPSLPLPTGPRGALRPGGRPRSRRTAALRGSRCSPVLASASEPGGAGRGRWGRVGAA